VEPRRTHARRPRLLPDQPGRPELIDHIVASKSLLTALSAVTAQAVIDTPLTSIDPADPTARRDAPSSDHAPVVATFTNL
jgi:exonuclease III